MNERLEELKRRAVAEADTSHIDFDNMTHTEIQMLGDIAVEQKFAELIVEEMYCFMVDATNNDEPWPSFEQIKKHFGVEE